MPSRRRFIPQSWKILHGVDLKGLDDAEAVAMTMRAPSECSSRFYSRIRVRSRSLNEEGADIFPTLPLTKRFSSIFSSTKAAQLPQIAM
jgi:hypothetical protein